MEMIERLLKALNDYQTVFSMLLVLILLWTQQRNHKDVSVKMIDLMSSTKDEVCRGQELMSDVLDKGLERNTRAILLLLSERGVALMQKFSNGYSGDKEATDAPTK